MNFYVTGDFLIRKTQKKRDFSLVISSAEKLLLFGASERQFIVENVVFKLALAAGQKSDVKAQRMQLLQSLTSFTS